MHLIIGLIQVLYVIVDLTISGVKCIVELVSKDEKNN
jgi:hypothetical protein